MTIIPGFLAKKLSKDTYYVLIDDSPLNGVPSGIVYKVAGLPTSLVTDPLSLLGTNKLMPVAKLGIVGEKVTPIPMDGVTDFDPKKAAGLFNSVSLDILRYFLPLESMHLVVAAKIASTESLTGISLTDSLALAEEGLSKTLKASAMKGLADLGFNPKRLKPQTLDTTATEIKTEAKTKTAPKETTKTKATA